MPKIREPPRLIMEHLVQRFRDGRLAVSDFDELQDWLESDPDVPNGKWYKRFKNFTLAERGELPSTFLMPGMAVVGQEVV
jgi:hypothetical protein